MIVIALLAASTIAVAARPEDDFEALQGRWRIVQFQAFGKEERGLTGRVEFRGDRLIETHIVVRRGALELLAGQEPKGFVQSIDGKTLRGIYRHEGDTFEQCFLIVDREQRLPTEFSAGPGSNRMLRVWSRFRGRESRDAGGPRGDLDGTWNLASQTIDGRPSPKSLIRGYRLSIAGGRYTLENEQVAEGSIRLDPATSPKRIDRITTEPTSGRTLYWPGIYRFEGGRLLWCYNGYGDARPTGFLQGRDPSAFVAYTLERERAD